MQIGRFLLLKEKMIIEVQQRNYYQILGIPRDASQNRIDHAYKRLVRRFDSANSDPSQKAQASLKRKIALLQEAYDTLSNVEKRDEHDQWIEEQIKPAPQSTDLAVLLYDAQLVEVLLQKIPLLRPIES